MITHIGLTAIPSIIALMMIMMGLAGKKIIRNKLKKANKKPKLRTILVPNFFNKNPITKFVAASEIK